jgi:hypothetical protein
MPLEVNTSRVGMRLAKNLLLGELVIHMRVIYLPSNEGGSGSNLNHCMIKIEIVVKFSIDC